MEARKLILNLFLFMIPIASHLMEKKPDPSQYGNPDLSEKIKALQEANNLDDFMRLIKSNESNKRSKKIQKPSKLKRVKKHTNLVSLLDGEKLMEFMLFSEIHEAEKNSPYEK